MEIMPLEVIIHSQESVKPSSPTPENHRHLKFSLLDQLALPVYVPVLLFYAGAGADLTQNERIKRLKATLPDVLTRFYPLAGRVEEGNESLCCNDEGATFVEAQVNVRLSEFLNQLDIDALRKFLPFDVGSAESAKGCILLVQTTSFECGGLSVGLLMSHKISDASSISTFVKSWTAAARGSESPELPKFIGACSLPPPEGPPLSTPTSDSDIHAKGVTKRLVFKGPKLAALKAKIAGATGKSPTRVEALTGLLWKSAIGAARSTSGVSKPSVIFQAVNLRKRLAPPLADSSIGNVLGYLTPEIMAAPETELQDFVGLLRKEITEFNQNGFKRYQDTEAFLTYIKNQMDPDHGVYSGDKNFYLFSSWSRFPFYEADFGWGVPLWYVGGISMFSNFFLMMDAKDGVGIEVLVTLSEEDMALFLGDQQLLEFASVNPNIVTK